MYWDYYNPLPVLWEVFLVIYLVTWSIKHLQHLPPTLYVFTLYVFTNSDYSSMIFGSVWHFQRTYGWTSFKFLVVICHWLLLSKVLDQWEASTREQCLCLHEWLLTSDKYPPINKHSWQHMMASSSSSVVCLWYQLEFLADIYRLFDRTCHKENAVEYWRYFPSVALLMLFVSTLLYIRKRIVVVASSVVVCLCVSARPFFIKLRIFFSFRSISQCFRSVSYADTNDIWS